MTTQENTSVKQVNCPTCQKIVPWTQAHTFRPFCSKKCQLIDFGEWANERNRIPAEDGPEDFRLDELDINPQGNEEGL
jgi:hypothetical protein